ncbi:nucleotidyltransferase family protein [Cylindrospermopsis raciborskii UAM/DH-MRr]|uniref:nucleotidyltransferase family protein n=1 Tax=Cylindrospermopsis raciborskii TaxID=77022 RepID=UPI0038796013
MESQHLKNWRQALVPPTATIQEVVRNLNEVAIQIALVTDPAGILLGTVSDGDVRRGLLKGLSLDSRVDAIMHRIPLVVPEAIDRALVLELMKVNKIHQIPIVDQENRVVGIHLWDQVTAIPQRTNLIVIMAGGKGTRLRPYTENCPKPMLTVSGKPMLEHIIERASSEGFNRFVLAIHYLGYMIEEYFGTGEKLNVEITYLREKTPLGTAGALSLLSSVPEEAFIVTNGDILTNIRYGDLLHFHHEHQAIATMAVRAHEWQHPFGVVQMQGLKIVGFQEKPIARSYINAGVYALNPEALTCLNPNQPCDMPSLFEKIQSQGDLAIAYPMHEPWLDVGRPDDLTRANNGIRQ